MTIAPASHRPVAPAAPLPASGVINLAGASNYLQVTGFSLDFGAMHLGASAESLLGIGNAAPQGAEITAGVAANTAGFAVEQTSLYLAAGQNGAIGVTFDPSAEGAVTGRLDLAEYAYGAYRSAIGGATIALYGTGFAYAAPFLSTTALDLGAVRAGGVLTGVVGLANGSSADAYRESLLFMTAVSPSVSTDTTSGTLLAGDSQAIGVTLDAGTAGIVRGALTIGLTSTGAGTSLLADTDLGAQMVAIQGAVYATAIAQLGATAVNVGSVHVGDSATVSLSVTNAAAGALADDLLASATVSGAGFSGSDTLDLAAGATDAFTAGFIATAEGTNIGTLSVASASHDAALTDLSIGQQQIALSGTVFAYAAPVLSATTLDLGAARVGDTLAGTLTVTNGMVADVYQESLSYSLSTVADLAAVNAAATVQSGASAVIGLGLSTANSGAQSIGATLALTSTGAGTSSLGDTALMSQAITVNGTVYQQAIAQLGTTSLDFGIVHVGDAVSTTLAVTNGAQGVLVDQLHAGVSSVSAGFTAFGTLDLAAGQSAGLAVTLDTSTAHTATGTLRLGFASRDIALAELTLADQSASLNAIVNNYASAMLAPAGGGFAFSGVGTAYSLGFGSILLGATAIESLSVSNAAQGPADLLSGTIQVLPGGTGFINTGLGPFTGLSAGQAYGGISVKLSATLSGSYTETLQMTSTGGNASGYSAVLAVQTLAVSATMIGSYTLNGAPQSITAGNGTDYVYAAANALLAADVINGSGGLNTLVLTGSGIHNLGAPKTLIGFQTVNATEVAGAGQIVTLRHNMNNATVNVASVAGGSITIYGASNNDVIQLGNGTDTVQIGSAAETVYGGAGTDTYLLSAAVSGAQIHAGTGTNLLTFTGGGTIRMGTNFTGPFTTVTLSGAAATSYAFTANTQQTLAIVAATGSARIVIGSAGQTVTGPSALVNVQATAAQAGVLVSNVGAGSVLEITSTGTATLNTAETGVIVKLDKACTLTMSRVGFITAVGQVTGDTIRAQATNQTLSSVLGSDTLVGYSGFGDVFSATAIGINKDTISAFGGNDRIDITDLAFGPATMESVSPIGSNTAVTISNGVRSVALTLIGSFQAASLVLASDGHAGTQISFSGSH